MKTKIKKTLSVFKWVIVLGLFAGFLLFLNNASHEVKEEENPWKAEAHFEGTPGWELIGENDFLKLFFDSEKVWLKIEDKKSGSVWYSNPENAEEDAIAFGKNKAYVKALLGVTYVDEQGSYFKIDSFGESVKNKTYSVEKRDNGVYVNFQFEEQAFEIPCFFGIEDEKFVARILNEGILHHGSLKIAKVDFLPFFGAGGLNDEGYLFVPDGSGALINFNNQKQMYQVYKQPVYGRNLAVNLNNQILCEQSASMPVFGVKKNNDAFYAVITEGEFQAELNAEVAKKTTENNTVYSSVVYIQSEKNTLMAGSSDEEETIMQSPQDIGTKPYEVSYFFLEKNSGFPEMAMGYSEYLKNEKGMKKTDISAKAALLNFVGGVKIRKTFLGVPYQSVEALSKFADVYEAVNSLSVETNGRFDVSMTNMGKGGTKNRIPTKVSGDENLGGMKGLKKAKAGIEDLGYEFFAVYDPVSIKRYGNGYNSFSSARNVTRSAAIQYEYKLTNGSKNTLKPYSSLVTPVEVPKITGKLTEDLKKKNLSGIGLDTIGFSLYSDYKKENVSMNETGAFFEEALQAAKENAGKILLRGAYAFAFPYADVITNVPVYSSRYDIEDEEVPFYQMVAGGNLSLYGEPVNLSGDEEEELLRMAAFGVSPSFELMMSDPEKLKETDYDGYYASCFKERKEEVANTITEFGRLSNVLGMQMTDYRMLNESVSCTTYIDGTLVYVNYSSEDQTVDGVTIIAKSFEVKEGR